MSSFSRGLRASNWALDRNPVLSGNALAMSSMLFWAAGFPAAELLLADWHPVFLSMVRLLMALAVLVPLWLLVDGWARLRNARWGRALVVGGVGFGLGTNLLLFAQWYTDPVTVALIATTTPILAALFEVMTRQRRLNARFIFGLTASVFGGAVAVGGQISMDFGIGVGLALAAGAAFVWASNATVRDFPDLSPVGRSAITFVGAALFTAFLFGTMWALAMMHIPRSVTPAQMGLLSIYAVAAMALSQILFIASVARLGIALSSFHINVAPFYVMVILIALGGAWDWRAALGAAIVGAGVVISQPRPDRDAARQSAA